MHQFRLAMRDLKDRFNFRGSNFGSSTRAAAKCALRTATLSAGRVAGSRAIRNACGVALRLRLIVIIGSQTTMILCQELLSARKHSEVAKRRPRALPATILVNIEWRERKRRWRHTGHFTPI